MKRSLLTALILSLMLVCSGCSPEDGMVLKDEPGKSLEEQGESLAKGMEDMLHDVERTARDMGRRAEDAMK